MTKNADKSETGLEELAQVAGGAKNIQNEVVATVIRVFQETVQQAQHEAIRANGPLGSTFPGHF